MAHLVDQMAYVGQRPWHGLGNQLPLHEPIDIWIRKAGLNWEVGEVPVRYMVESVGSLNAVLSYPANKVLYRSDTHAPLSVVSQRFKVVQPREILEFYRDLTEQSGFELETAGSLHSGKKIFALAKTGQSFTLRGNDVTHAYVLLATACDGSMATTAQFTSVRVVCNNTLAIALNGKSGAVKVPHHTKFDAQAVKQELGIAVSTWDDFMYRMKALSERRVHTSEVSDYLTTVFSSTGQLGRPAPANQRTVALVLDLFNGRGKGAELTGAKGTAFGLLNAVTQFVDHERRAKSLDHRLDSAWFGKGAYVKQTALDQALSLLS
jgi:phage/plasmid-like protein (TIGR03299 family)